MKLAVHLHLYHLDQLSHILRYLTNLNAQFYDLFVTLIKHNKDIEELILSFNPNAKIMIVPNRGYDIGPFIEFLHAIDLNNYDLILKLHTKGQISKNHTVLNGHDLDNKLWAQILFDSLLKSRQRVANNLSVFRDEKVGMLSSAHCLAQEERTYKKLLPQINQELKAMGLKPVKDVRFIAGTMFYARPQIFKPLLRYSIKDFDTSSAVVKDGKRAHVFERLFGILTEQAGLKIHTIKYDKYALQFMLSKIKHFLFQKKLTSHGNMIIKVCRIPIYHKRGVCA